MRYLAVFFLTAFIFGCATGYQSVGFKGGFSETQLSENVWKVNFRGNGYTSMERVTDFNLFRCAELTIRQGYKYFLIINENSHVATSTHATPVQSHTTGQVHGFGNSAFYSGSTYYTGGQTYTFRKPSNQNTIFMLDKKPENMNLVYDARFILKSLADKYPSDFSNYPHPPIETSMNAKRNSDHMLPEDPGDISESLNDHHVGLSKTSTDNIDQPSARAVTLLHKKERTNKKDQSADTHLSKSNARLTSDKQECQNIAMKNEIYPYKKVFLDCMKTCGWRKK